jgi:murein DD-endopeptidase MepM/ murein hydrolase activator NlpD
MQIIVLSRRGRVQRALHLGPLAVSLCGVLLLCCVAAAFWFGGQSAGGSRILGASLADPRPDLMIASVRGLLAQQREAVQAAQTKAEQDLDALAQQLGQLQARAIRIDVLGERLVDMVGLDAAEFSFGSVPGQGGPAPAGDGEAAGMPDFVTQLAEVAAVLEARAQELEILERAIIDARTAEQMHPQGRPVSVGWISSQFGWRSDPMTGRKSFHEGTDFVGKAGSPIFAAASGIVKFAGTRRGFGNVVELAHGRGYVTRYAHNRKNLVKEGERVAKGQKIALMGSSGRVTGTHLHFEVLRGDKPLNPMSFLKPTRPSKKAGGESKEKPQGS